MSAGALTYKAAIDWIELEIQLSRQSNFWTVQETLKAALQHPQHVALFVEALDSGSGNAASAFRFRIQNPTRLSELARIIAALHDRFGLDAVRPTAIELAFNTYCQSGSIR